jgi:transcriptional regulator with XRE-family HTH domain
MESILVTNARNEFGQELRSLRVARHLTLQDLEYRSGIKYSAISAIESGTRATGPKLATALADALVLQGQQRQEFIEMASVTKTFNKQTKAAEILGSAVLYKLHTVGLPLKKLYGIKLTITSQLNSSLGNLNPEENPSEHSVTVTL